MLISSLVVSCDQLNKVEMCGLAAEHLILLMYIHTIIACSTKVLFRLSCPSRPCDPVIYMIAYLCIEYFALLSIGF